MKTFDDDFKKNAIKLVLEEKMTIAQVSQDLGLGRSTLNKWLAEHRQGKLIKDERQIQENVELKRLRRENRILKQERDILKKAMGIFSSMSNANTEL